MIVVKVELHSARTKKVKILAAAIIHNISKKGVDPKKGDYEVLVAKKTDVNNLKKSYSKPLRRGQVLNYPRLSYNVWRLIIRALLSAFPEENKSIKSGSKN